MEEEKPDAAAARINEVLNGSVEELELSVRSYNCLKNANIQTIGDLVQKTEAEMLRTKNFGRKSLNEIKEILGEFGLEFGMRFDAEGRLLMPRDSAFLSDWMTLQDHVRVSLVSPNSSDAPPKKGRIPTVSTVAKN